MRRLAPAAVAAALVGGGLAGAMAPLAGPREQRPAAPASAPAARGPAGALDRFGVLPAPGHWPLPAAGAALGLLLLAGIRLRGAARERRLEGLLDGLGRGDLAGAVAAEDEPILGGLGRSLAAAARALRETTVSGAYLDHLFDKLPAAVVATDAAGRVVRWNERARELTGYEAGEVLGRPRAEIPGLGGGAVPRPDPAGAGAPAPPARATVRCRDGREITVSVSAGLLPPRGDGPPGTVEVLFDVTGAQRPEDPAPAAELEANRSAALRAVAAQRETVAALEAALEAAAEASQSKTQLLLDLSREILTPLNAILGFATLLREGPLFPEEAEYAEAIAHSGEHLKDLVDQAADLARAQAGQIDLRRRRVELRDLLESVVAIYRPGALACGLRFGARVSPRVPPAVLADATRLRQILDQLIGNAVQATARGEVSVELDWEGGALRARVRDTGPEVSAPGPDRVFEPFCRRVDEAARAGTGLGLPMVRELARAMGGTVTAQAAAGGGMCIGVLLPLEAAAPAAGRTSGPEGRGTAVLPAGSDPEAAGPPCAPLGRAGLRRQGADGGDPMSGLEALRREYLADAGRDLDRAADDLRDGRLDAVARLAHRLRGSGGSYGYAGVSQAAAGLERACEQADPAAVRRALAELLGLVGELAGEAAVPPGRGADRAPGDGDGSGETSSATHRGFAAGPAPRYSMHPLPCADAEVASMPEAFAPKRRFPRIPSENALLVRKLGPEAVEGFAKTQVVGLGGCMFVSDEPIGVGAYLDLLISVRGRVVKALGRVVYETAKPDAEVEVGVEFVKITPHDRQVIESLFGAKTQPA